MKTKPTQATGATRIRHRFYPQHLMHTWHEIQTAKEFIGGWRSFVAYEEPSKRILELKKDGRRDEVESLGGLMQEVASAYKRLIERKPGEGCLLRPGDKVEDLFLDDALHSLRPFANMWRELFSPPLPPSEVFDEYKHPPAIVEPEVLAVLKAIKNPKAKDAKKPGPRRDKFEKIAAALKTLQDHPTLPDKEIAKQVEVHPSTLSRDKRYQDTAARVRGEHQGIAADRSRTKRADFMRDD